MLPRSNECQGGRVPWWAARVLSDLRKTSIGSGACNWALALCLLLHAACAPLRTAAAGGVEPQVVRARPLPEGRLELSFAPTAPAPALDVLRREEAQTVLTVFYAAMLEGRPRIHVLAPPRPHDPESEGWAQPLRANFESRFGLTLLPESSDLEQSRLFRALRLSPRYMGDGVREAARELFSSPLFVASVCLSVLVYFAAWMAPEPLFTKGFAATVTVTLAIAVGLLELTHLALACVRLYREAEAARTEEELEAAAARFGKALGGTGLRVLVLVASFGLGKAVPPVPPGGLWGILGSPRYAVEGGLALGTASTAHVVAEGSLIVSGVAVGEVAQRLCGGLALCATTEDVNGERGPKSSTRYGPRHTKENPAHNEAIERELAAREAAGHGELRKNKAQWNSRGDRVFDGEATNGPRFRRPDVSSLRPDGVRHNTNYVSNPGDLKRELEAFEAMVRADRRALHELYLLDGTLVRRYVPAGVTYP